MPIPLTPESVEAFALRHIEQAEKTEDLLSKETRHDWAHSAALLLLEHRYYEHADRIFARCNALRKQINS